MSLSATFTIEMSMKAISAAIIATAVMPPLEPWTWPFMAVSAVRRGGARSLGGDDDLGAHAGAQGQALAIIELDEDRDALGDLGEVARRVVGRQQREAAAGAGGDAVDVASELHVM